MKNILKTEYLTAERAGIPVRNRAAELQIRVMDLDDLAGGHLPKAIRKLMNP